MNKSCYIMFGKRINLCHRIFKRKCQSQRNEVAVTHHFPKPVIPIRIKRGPTDILKALATTVSRDPTAPAYKFHDDPYLYPFSMYDKRSFALSKESGRKTAQWIRDNNPNLFNHQPEDPVIKNFIPKMTFTEESEISEDDLIYLINNTQVTEAISVYKLCLSKNAELSDIVRQSLLELVSFYNCDDTFDMEWIEEKKSEPMDRFKQVKTWKDGSFAEELFNDLKETGEKAYCAIIRGMCKHLQIEKAWQLYQEALEKNFDLDTETFNSIIRIAPLLQTDYELQWDILKEIFDKMIKLKIPPNVGTLNAFLEALSSFRGWKKADTLSLQILKEFKNLNVEPSLATYFHLIKINYKSRNRAPSGLLPSILNEIEFKTFDVKDINDVRFFFAAMEVCYRYLLCFETATRVHNFLTRGDNFKFLGGNLEENYYLKFYFIMAMNSLPLEDFMELYDSWVPHLYTPHNDSMKELINVIGHYGDLKLLPRIWSDCIFMELSRSEEIITLTLDVMDQQNLEKIDKELAKQLVNICWHIWKNPGSSRGKGTEWTGAMIGNCLSVLVRCKDVEKSLLIFNTVIKRPNSILGVIPIRTLKHIFDAVVEMGLYKEVMMTLRYCKENDYEEEADQWSKDLCNKSTTPEDVKSRLKSAFSL